MIKRLGIIIWWIGAIFVGLTLLSGWLSYQSIAECKAQAKLDSEKIALIPHKKVQIQQAPDNTVDPFKGLEDADENPSRADFLADHLKKCESQNDGFYLLLIFGTLICWSLAFVLGGSFWRPPKNDNAKT